VNCTGVLNLKKKAGPTSHDVVASVRRLVPKKTKVGHAGTLDPMAEGVLPICVGAATKIFPYLLDCQKTYRATMVFGRVTDTQDTTGETLSEEAPGEISLEEAQRFLDTFRGEGIQVPPMYSALKVGGTRLHELARAGKEVEREGRAITVFDIQALEIVEGSLTFDVSCSRGTYIRSLCHDMGALQGTGGCMSALTRTQLGPFRIEEGIFLEEAEALAGEGRLSESLMTLSDALSHLPAITLHPKGEERFRNGMQLEQREYDTAEPIQADSRVRVLRVGGELIAVGIGLPGGGRIRADRVFAR
jgi:tRNA pseudouridine55 synthase